MELNWEQMRVQFKHGGGLPWHADFELRPHWFKRRLIDYDLWYIWHGEGNLRTETGEVIPLRTGMCLLIRPGSVFHVWQNQGTGFAVRFFHFDLYDAAGSAIPPSAFASLPLWCQARDARYFDMLTRRLTDLTAMGPLMPVGPYPVDAHQAINTLLKTVLTEFVLTCHSTRASAAPGPGADQVTLVWEVISRIYQEPGRFDPAPLVAEAGYTMGHFRRMFKLVVGQTPHQVQINARIARARQLLEGSDLNVGAIADELGYASIYYFSMQFKERVGVTPSAYRKRYRD